MNRLINIDEEDWDEAEKIGKLLPVEAKRPAVLKEAIKRGLLEIKTEETR